MLPVAYWPMSRFTFKLLLVTTISSLVLHVLELKEHPLKINLKELMLRHPHKPNPKVV